MIIPLLIPGFDWNRSTLTAAADAEAFHHMVRVRRIKPHHQLRLTDGRGRVQLRALASLTKTAMELGEVLEDRTVPRPSTTLWLARLEKNALEEALSLCGQLPLRAVHLLQTDRTIVQPDPSANLQQRMAHILTAACTQSEQAWLPEIDWNIQPLREIPIQSERWALATERLAPSLGRPAAPADHVLVGPEGGWSDEEHAWLRRLAEEYPTRVTLLSLGSTVLRAEAAAFLSLWAAGSQ